MRTDDLIRALVTDLEPEPQLADGLWSRLGLAGLCCVAVVGGVLGYRADLGAAMVNPLSALRPILALVLLAAALREMLHLARPDGRLQGRLGPMRAVAGLAVAAFALALATTPVGAWAGAVRGSTLVACLVSIPVLSIVPVTILLWTLRRSASSRPGWLGAMAGLAGGSMAALAYTLHCTEDSPLFYVTWYGLAILAVTLVASRIGARSLRW